MPLTSNALTNVFSLSINIFSLSPTPPTTLHDERKYDTSKAAILAANIEHIYKAQRPGCNVYAISVAYLCSAFVTEHIRGSVVCIRTCSMHAHI